MRLTIHQLFLFPDDPRHNVRPIDFKPGVVNVVTGTSGRGKSAITQIIDYCLGSGKCSIPVGPIRDTVGWYGLLLEVESHLIFVARRAPGDQQSTDDYYVAEGPHIAIPIRPEKNNTRLVFTSKMGALSGLTNLDLAAGDPKGFDARASFRDFAAFNFLPQHIVANPQTLFFKADTTDHREKLRKVFPLALGVVDAQYLLAEHEERDLSRRLQEFQYEAARRKKASEAWLAELHGYLDRSRELGLVTDGTLTRDTAPSEIIDALRRAVRDPDRTGGASPTVGNTETAVVRLNAILDEEARIAREISDRRRQLQKLLALSQSLKDYGGQLRLQYARVEGVGWFEERLKDGDSCPICGSESDSAKTELAGLVQAAKGLKEQLESAGHNPVALEKEESKLRTDVRDLESQLLVRRRERRELEEASQEAARARQRMSEVFRFMGRVEQAIAGMDAASGTDDLSAAITSFQQQLSDVRARLLAANRAVRQTSALKKVSRLIQPTAQIMQLERRDDVAALVPNELALTFEDKSGRQDYLWEIGSGENWMGYHIAVLLALHEFFLSLKSCPVPSFLVIDQPTQVYFPARDDSYERKKAEASGRLGRAGDILRARHIFEALSAAVKRMKGKLQVIVTEHADELTWGDIDSIHLVENWRGDRFLVPSAWIGA